MRSVYDCVIASVAIRNATPVLHRDADFSRLAQVSPLQALSVFD